MRKKYVLMDNVVGRMKKKKMIINVFHHVHWEHDVFINDVNHLHYLIVQSLADLDKFVSMVDVVVLKVYVNMIVHVMKYVNSANVVIIFPAVVVHVVNVVKVKFVNQTFVCVV
jgi:hypothetical protein